MSWLVFVDTNVLLDFYRMGGEGAKRQLEFLDGQKENIILTSQIQMEFLKNRQTVILDTIGNIKKLDGTVKSFPPLLIEAKPVDVIKTKFSEIEAQQKKIRKRIERVLLNPSINDQLYQCLQRLFKFEGEYILSETSDEYSDVVLKAKRRWMLGFPPRKNGDTSIGDAVNWEWILQCAIKSGSDIIIVSRDKDYGHRHENKNYVNDWLSAEFRKRVSKKRKLILTEKITDAMTRLEVEVSLDDKTAEENELQVLRASPISSSHELSNVFD